MKPWVHSHHAINLVPSAALNGGRCAPLEVIAGTSNRGDATTTISAGSAPDASRPVQDVWLLMLGCEHDPHLGLLEGHHGLDVQRRRAVLSLVQDTGNGEHGQPKRHGDCRCVSIVSRALRKASNKGLAI